MKSRILSNVSALMMMAAVMSSCEKVLPTESAGSDGDERPNVVLRVSQFETIPFDFRTRADAGDVCTKLCFDIYDEDGQKVKYVNQKLEDAKFGEASFSLPEGDYYLVVLGHSASRTPSFATKEMKITASGALTDMFWECVPLHVSDENVTKNLVLKRIVSMVRFIADDNLPEEANELFIEYKGSKGTFSALTGYATTTASQKLTVDVDPSDDSYDFYMIPRSDEDELLNVKITSRYNDGSSATEFSEKSIESIPVRRNCITICRGNLFDGKSSSRGTVVQISIDDVWNESIEFAF